MIIDTHITIYQFKFMNLSAFCTISKLLIVGHILEVGSAPLEQHMKTAPVITCPTYRWSAYTEICMYMSESIHIMYHVYILKYLVVFLRCGCLWYVAALVCWVAFRVIFFGCKKRGLCLYKMDYMEYSRLQGWSSWLWRRFHTAEVPGSIPGFCILDLSVTVIILVMNLEAGPLKPYTGNQLEYSCMGLSFASAGTFYTWLW